MTNQQSESALTFPCDFDIKAMGETSNILLETIIDIVEKYSGNVTPDRIKTKESSGGKYTSVTVTIRATSKTQLDNIYRDLSAHSLIKFAL